MPRTLPLSVLILLALGHAVAAAQTTAPANVITPAPPPREGTVGPEQLRDFSLPGTRSQGQTTTTAPVATPSPVPAPATTPSRTTPATTAPATGTRQAPAAPSPAERAATTASDPAASAPTARPATPSAAPSLLPATPAPSSAAPAGPVFDVPVTSTPSLPTPSDPAPAQGGGLGWWPWLLVAAAAGVLLALMRRQRRGRVAAGGYPLDEEERVEAPAPAAFARAPAAPAAPEPAPAPAPEPDLPAGIVTSRAFRPSVEPAAPSPDAATPLAVPAPPAGAVVSTRLRPWIDMDLAVREIVIDAAEAVIRFDLLVRNDGAASARGVVIEAIALNAGETQGEELARFYARPVGSSDGIDEIAPREGATVSHELRLRRDAIRLYALGGRETFVPVVAFNASYRLASGEARTSAAWLVGREVPGAERLGPLPLAPGDSRLGGIGVRRLADAVRR